jgi:hypothetical protein
MEEMDNKLITKPQETLVYASLLEAQQPVDAPLPKVPDQNGKSNVWK